MGCRKIPYLGKSSAADALREMRSRGARRIYFCVPCGAYHLTSWASRRRR